MYVKNEKLYFDDGTCLTDYKDPVDAKIEELSAKVDFLAMILYNILQRV